MPSFAKHNKDASKEETRKLAQRVVSTLKKIGISKTVTLKNVQQFIKEEYANTPHNIAKLNEKLRKALAAGADYKTRTSAGNQKPQTLTSLILEARRRRRRGGRGRKGKGRRHRRRSHSRRRY